jgi:hypothetical protein
MARPQELQVARSVSIVAPHCEQLVIVILVATR